MTVSRIDFIFLISILDIIIRKSLNLFNKSSLTFGNITYLLLNIQIYPFSLSFLYLFPLFYALSADMETTFFLLLISIMCRHEYKVEYLCKFESTTSLGISRRASMIAQYYRYITILFILNRYLLSKSRELCTLKIKGRILTNDECDFCGCVFAISFIRETYFQKRLLQAIHTGFIEWYSLTCQVNCYRGIRSANLHQYYFSTYFIIV